MTEPAEVATQPEVEPPDVVDAAERLPAEIEAAVVRKYFSLTIGDLEQVERCRGPANKLGFVMWTFSPGAAIVSLQCSALSLLGVLVHGACLMS